MIIRGIKIDDITTSYSANECPWSLNYHNVQEARNLYIGKLNIGKLFLSKNKRYFVSAINYSSFKSVNSAVRGIKERMLDNS